VAESLVPILATREFVVPLASDPIIWGRSIWSFRHLKHQNMSTGNDFTSSSRKNVSAPFLATKEALVPLANVPIMLGRSILSFSHLECQNPSIISDSIDSARYDKKSGKGWQQFRNGGGNNSGTER